MAIGPGNKITTTGLIDKKPMIPDVPVMQSKQVQNGPPTQAQVTPPVRPGGELANEFPDATPMELEFAERAKSLTDEDQTTLQSVLSPSVRAALEKIIPEFKEVMNAFGSNEPNVIFPLSYIVKFAMTRYGGGDEQEAVNNFMADVQSMNQQMEQPNNVPPGTEQPTTETAGLMTSPQNMETV
jgi:hypothetical protein